MWCACDRLKTFHLQTNKLVDGNPFKNYFMHWNLSHQGSEYGNIMGLNPSLQSPAATRKHPVRYGCRKEISYRLYSIFRMERVVLWKWLRLHPQSSSLKKQSPVAPPMPQNWEVWTSSWPNWLLLPLISPLLYPNIRGTQASPSLWE